MGADQEFFIIKLPVKVQMGCQKRHKLICIACCIKGLFQCFVTRSREDIYTVSIRSTPEVRYYHYFRAVSLLITKYSCGVMTYRIIFIREPPNYESFGDSFFAALQQFRMTRHPV